MSRIRNPLLFHVGLAAAWVAFDVAAEAAGRRGGRHFRTTFTGLNVVLLVGYLTTTAAGTAGILRSEPRAGGPRPRTRRLAAEGLLFVALSILALAHAALIRGAVGAWPP